MDPCGVNNNAAFFEAFVNCSGLIVLGYANFSLPLSLDLKLIKVRSVISKRIQLEDERTNITTKGVFILVTASITLVIVTSITDSLTLAVVSFVFMVGVMVRYI